MPKDLVFVTRNGTPLGRRTVLRHLKAAAKRLMLPKEIDFRTFRTTHASLDRSGGSKARGHPRQHGSQRRRRDQNVYGKSWWVERVDAVSAAVDLLMGSGKEDEEMEGDDEADTRTMLFAKASA